MLIVGVVLVASGCGLSTSPAGVQVQHVRRHPVRSAHASATAHARPRPGHPSRSSGPSPAPSSTIAPIAPTTSPTGGDDTLYTGVLSVVGTAKHACLVLTATDSHRYQLLSGDGLWVPSTTFAANGKVETARSGFQRGTGQTVIPGVVFKVGARVSLFGYASSDSVGIVHGGCSPEDIPALLTVYSVKAAD
jgi:hypothetical protein